MRDSEVERLLDPYNPWVSPDRRAGWRNALPAFRRPIFETLCTSLKRTEPRQIISITGPRRVGKSTLLHQLIEWLLQHEGVPEDRVVYYSLDDPALSAERDAGPAFEALLQYLHRRSPKQDTHVFLDEIQTLPKWELYLKKYVDLGFPFRFTISGSASSPIFKHSRESLLGRIEDHHVLPFSFREYALFEQQRQQRNDLAEELQRLELQGQELSRMQVRAPTHVDVHAVNLSRLSRSMWDFAQECLQTYVLEGGFPEVWSFNDPAKKLDYLFDNQVKKVIYEDLVIHTELRKPESLKQFFVALLQTPGSERSKKDIAEETGVAIGQIEKYLPLLEMTDLLRPVSKFRKSSVRVRRGNQKFYLVDLALRNAVMRISSLEDIDESTMGLYAENMVFNALAGMKGHLGVDYYRERNTEVDFIVHLTAASLWPIEVKYRRQIRDSDHRPLWAFAERFKTGMPVLVTRRREDFGPTRDRIFQIPLCQFLLMFG